MRKFLTAIKEVAAAVWDGISVSGIEIFAALTGIGLLLAGIALIIIACRMSI